MFCIKNVIKWNFLGMRFWENVPYILKIVDPEIQAIQSQVWPATFEFSLVVRCPVSENKLRTDRHTYIHTYRCLPNTPNTFSFLASLRTNEWFPRVSIRGPLAHQTHDPGCQANLCRWPTNELVPIYTFAWWRNRTLCILSFHATGLLWYLRVLGLNYTYPGVNADNMSIT